MIPLTTLYHEYIGRSKLSEQKTHLSIWFLPSQERSEQQENFVRQSITVLYFEIQLWVPKKIFSKKCMGTQFLFYYNSFIVVSIIVHVDFNLASNSKLELTA